MDIPAIPITYINDQNPERRKSKRKRKSKDHCKSQDRSIHYPHGGEWDEGHLDVVA